MTRKKFVYRDLVLVRQRARRSRERGLRILVLECFSTWALRFCYGLTGAVCFALLTGAPFAIADFVPLWGFLLLVMTFVDTLLLALLTL